MRIDISDRLVIIGTSHVAKQSVKEIKETFDEFQPDIVAIELDVQRLQGLLQGKQRKQNFSPTLIKHVGVTGYLFLLIGSFVQKRIGHIVKVDPGAEMKVAHDIARKNNKKVLLADQPLQITLKRLSKQWKFKEKLLLVWDVLVSPFKKQEMLSINLHSVPSGEVLMKILTHFKNRYPSLYKSLVSDRDRFLAHSVKEHHKRFPDDKVLLVVGAGHTAGIKKILQEKK